SNLGLTNTSPGPDDRGQRYLYGGQGSTEAVMNQMICIPSLSPYIINQTLSYNFSGWLGGYGTEADSSMLMIMFVDANDNANYSAFKYLSGPNAAARNNISSLLLSSVTGRVPLGTVYVVLKVFSIQQVGPYVDGYADQISFVLSQEQ
ncbi:unnamed protein product, partial [Didymodactylos carnosus]